MADYSPLIARAIDALADNTGEARRAIYERARHALVTQLRSLDPPLPEDDITRERLSLEEAIRRIEADASAKEAVEAALAEREREQSEAENPPVSVAGAPQVHEAAKAAEQLGQASEEVRRSVEDAREALAEAVPEAERIDPPLTHKADEGVPHVEAMAPDKAAHERAEAKPESGDKPSPVPMSDAGALLASAAKPWRTTPAEPGVPSPATPAGEPALQPLRPITRAEMSGVQLNARRSRSLFVPLLAVLAVLGAIIGAYALWQSYRAPRPETTSIAVREEPKAPPVDKQKSSDRIAQAEPSAPPAAPAAAPVMPPVANTPPATPAAQPAAPAVAVAPAPQPVDVQPERAMLLEEAPVSKQAETLPATVTWRTETLSGGTGQPPDVAIRADIDVPDRKMAVTMTIRRNTDATLPASHTVELLFKLPRDFAYGGVSNVPGLLGKVNEQARGMPLVGQSVRVMNGFFFIGLSNTETDRLGNVMQLKERPWFDIPIEYDNRRRAVLSIAKGASGQKAFEDAFRAWGE